LFHFNSIEQERGQGGEVAAPPKRNVISDF